MSIRFFNIKIPVVVGETIPMKSAYERDPDEVRDVTMVVTVEMSPGASARDAVEELGRRLSKMCNDDPPYEGG